MKLEEEKLQEKQKKKAVSNQCQTFVVALAHWIFSLLNLCLLPEQLKLEEEMLKAQKQEAEKKKREEKAKRDEKLKAEKKRREKLEAEREEKAKAEKKRKLTKSSLEMMDVDGDDGRKVEVSLLMFGLFFVKSKFHLNSLNLALALRRKR